MESKRLNLYRGHNIEMKNGVWVYSDTQSPVNLDPDRICGVCHKSNTSLGHDDCIANLPGVINACCGHGNIDDAYVVFFDGQRISGNKALHFQSKYQIE